MPDSSSKTNPYPLAGWDEEQQMLMRRRRLSFILLWVFVLAVANGLSVVSGQSRAISHRAKKGSICGNPTVACKTSVPFQPNDLPFRVPAKAVIFDTELFYAIILKSIPANEDQCNIFIPETERLEAQSLFPDHKVFTSRCVEPGELFYTSASEKHRIMAVYAGTTLKEAKRQLEAVAATGKFSGANIRRMRTGFNGT
jgi:hypothetical protein